MTTKAAPNTVLQNPDIHINIVETALQNTEQLMLEVVSSDVSILQDASVHILEAGGKRIRPKVTILSYLACGGEDVDYALPVAAAIELVHTASIVHDDINDHGIMRRGRPSVNQIWGRTFALLTGDYLFTKVYELMAPYKDLNIIFAEATTALLEGETLQAMAVKENNFTREVYFEIISRKTASLFKAGAVLGAKLAGSSRDQSQALERYGYNVGLAFQIVDDILDLIGDEAKLGKTSGIDLQQGKGFASINQNGSDLVDSLKDKVLSGERLNEARQQSRALIQSAIMALDVLPESLYKEQLIELANLVIERDF